MYDEERHYFKGVWTISFELKNKIFFYISQLDLASMGEEYFSLGRLSTHHQQSTEENQGSTSF
jgi:hypothetical protein